jgi:hypothetical protein
MIRKRRLFSGRGVGAARDRMEREKRKEKKTTAGR